MRNEATDLMAPQASIEAFKGTAPVNRIEAVIVIVPYSEIETCARGRH
jgi:hypothetical protein